MKRQDERVIEYLDPVSPNRDRKLFVPAVGELEGKTIGFLTNGWRSYNAMGERIEQVSGSASGSPPCAPTRSPLRARRRKGCSSAWRRNAMRPSSAWRIEAPARRGVSTTRPSSSGAECPPWSLRPSSSKSSRK